MVVAKQCSSCSDVNACSSVSCHLSHARAHEPPTHECSLCSCARMLAVRTARPGVRSVLSSEQRIQLGRDIELAQAICP